VLPLDTRANIPRLTCAERLADTTLKRTTCILSTRSLNYSATPNAWLLPPWPVCWRHLSRLQGTDHLPSKIGSEALLGSGNHRMVSVFLIFHRDSDSSFCSKVCMGYTLEEGISTSISTGTSKPCGHKITRISSLLPNSEDIAVSSTTTFSH
jgi:hypothetical protein